MDRGRRAVLMCFTTILLACTSAKTGDNRVPQNPVFKVGVDTVFLRVSVTDPLDRCVTGLSKENFRVYEDKVEQKISSFSEEFSSVSVGILLDTSGSMKTHNNLVAARAALHRFLDKANPGDEFFLIVFNRDVSLVKNFTQDVASVLSAGSLMPPSGSTAIWDAVYRGLDQIKVAKNEKKALLLITDGEDNSSRYSPSEVREFAKESDTQIYVIGEPGELGYGRDEIQAIVQLTGGRAFFPDNLNSLDYCIDLVDAELHNQYVLGYVPSHRDHDGKWRRIQVKLDGPKGLPKLIVRSREGYYSAKN